MSDGNAPMVLHTATGTPVLIIEGLNAQVQRRMQIFRTAGLIEEASQILHEITDQLNNEPRAARGYMTPIAAEPGRDGAQQDQRTLPRQIHPKTGTPRTAAARGQRYRSKTGNDAKGTGDKRCQGFRTQVERATLYGPKENKVANEPLQLPLRYRFARHILPSRITENHGPRRRRSTPGALQRGGDRGLRPKR